MWSNNLSIYIEKLQPIPSTLLLSTMHLSSASHIMADTKGGRYVHGRQLSYLEASRLLDSVALGNGGPCNTSHLFVGCF